MKIALWLIIGGVICFVVLSLVGKGMVAGYNAGTTDAGGTTTDPRIDALLAKGYNLEEAKQIIASQDRGNDVL